MMPRRPPSHPLGVRRSRRIPSGSRTLVALAAVLLTTLATSACRDRLVDLPEGGLPFGVAFWVYASPDTISAGEEATIILNIENTNDHDVDIDLPSRCGMVWWIEDSDGERVFPREGDECGVNARMGSLTSTDRWGVWHLFPQQSFKFDYTWAGMRWSQGGLVPAEPGTYTLVGSIGREAESMARATSRVTVR